MMWSWILSLSATTSISCDLDYKDAFTVQKFRTTVVVIISSCPVRAVVVQGSVLNIHNIL